MAYRTPSDALLTLGEFARLPEDPHYRYELVRGRVVREPPPGHAHGRLQLRLGGMLERFVAAHGLGYVVSESGFVLEKNPDTVRGPDIAFVSRERHGEELPARWLEAAPDLAIEIASPGDRVAALVEKVAQYLAAGSRMVWLIDPQERSATIHTPGGEIRVLHEDDHITGEEVVPRFSCLLRELFD